VPQPWVLAKKVQSALIGSRPCNIKRAIDEPYTYKSPKMCHPLGDKPSLKWASSRQCLSPPKISLERLNLETSNLVCMLIIATPILRNTNCPWNGAWSLSHDLVNYRKICDNISKTVQNVVVIFIYSFILLNSNSKWYARYGMVMLPLTLGDP